MKLPLVLLIMWILIMSGCSDKAVTINEDTTPLYKTCRIKSLKLLQAKKTKYEGGEYDVSSGPDIGFYCSDSGFDTTDNPDSFSYNSDIINDIKVPENLPVQWTINSSTSILDNYRYYLSFHDKDVYPDYDDDMGTVEFSLSSLMYTKSLNTNNTRFILNGNGYEQSKGLKVEIEVEWNE